ncbi:flagellar protein FlgN [Niallia taxi]|uniref:flagellar protein FlgN n=1 Tax=Niallia taxi TaxID=2499688 RepID=UPI0015F5E211|nr:flagellar protein FlgN [Niallia taxi]
MYQPLIYALEGLIEVHHRLLEHANNKKELLIKGDVAQLSKALAVESKLARQLSKLEQERQSVIQDYIREKNLSSQSMTLADVLETLPDGEEKVKVQELSAELKGLIEELQEVNQLNGRLLKDALDFVNDSIEMITDDTDPMNYKRPAGNPHDQSNNSARRNFFDYKA